MDFNLQELKTFTIRARFITDQKIPPGAQVTVTSGLYYREPVVSQGSFGSGPRIPPESQNRFEVGEVPPGRYWVTVTIGIVDGTPPPGPSRPPPSQTPEQEAEGEAARLKEFEAFLASPAIKFVRGLAAVDVVDSDVDGVVVQCALSPAIQGRVSIEGGDWASVAERDRIRVSVEQPRYGIQPEGGTLAVPPIEVRTDGSFGYPLFFPSNGYRLSVSALPDDVYVKTAWLGSTDILGKSFTIAGPKMDDFEIVLSTRGGRIEGTAVPNATILLAPEAQLERIDLFRVATADAAGRFSLRGIAPGAYTLFAFEDRRDSYKGLDPAHQAAGSRVQIREDSRLTVKL
jgi:hypothetical protein